jgi:hypothetical protein
MLKHEPILAEDYQELQVHRFEWQQTILRCFCEGRKTNNLPFFIDSMGEQMVDLDIPF